MPVYNAEKYVKQALESILAQSYSNLEILVIDDGSTDQSLAVIERIIDPRVAVIRNPVNKGLIATLNSGLERAGGKYIARMDADDLAHCDRIAKQVNFLEANAETGVVGTAYQELTEQGPDKKVQFLSSDDEIRTVLLFNSSLAHPTVMFRTSVLRDHAVAYDREFRHAEDYEMWVRLTQYTKLANLPDVLLQYRVHPAQVSRTASVGLHDTAVKVRAKVLERLGIHPTENEIALHNALGSGQTLSGTDALHDAEMWLRKLIRANEQSRYAEPAVFNAYLSGIFQDICARASVGLRGYRYYFASPLAQYRPTNFMLNTKFLIKCLIR